MTDRPLSKRNTSGVSVRIRQARALSYRVPSDSGRSAMNYVVDLVAETSDGRTIEGLGEGQPRWSRTGDDAGDSWQFLNDAVSRMEGLEFPIDDRESVINSVRMTIMGMRQLAEERCVDEKYSKPFRGTILGIEAALLDLGARALDITLAQLLGKVRDELPEAPARRRLATSAIEDLAFAANGADSDDVDDDDDEVPGDGSAAYHRLRFDIDVEELREVIHPFVDAATQGAGSEHGTRVWLSVGNSLTREEASQFVTSVLDAVEGRDQPLRIIISQPVARKYGDHTAVLQKMIDDRLSHWQGSSSDIRVLGDQSVWDEDSFLHLRQFGRLRAINVRPARAGGLLASIDLVNAALSHEPDVFVCLNGMGNMSRLSTSAAHQLGLALPHLDFANFKATVESKLPLSEVPGEKLEISESPDEAEDQLVREGAPSEDPEDSGFAEDADGDEPSGEVVRVEFGSERNFDVAHIEKSGETGIGVRMSFISLVNDVENMVTYPTPPLPSFEGMRPNEFEDIDDLHPLGARGSKGHLLEREALALGLSTTRFARGVFTATDEEHEPLNFKWNRNPLVSGVALGLCTHKEGTRLQLQRAGIPVPQGRTFVRGDIDNARAFAARIGYPVVMKPAMGVRGIGVVANIPDEVGLNHAYELMTSSRLGDQDFIVEKHVHGKDYRIVVVGDQVVAAILREPASVVGDGEQTVAELLLNRNSARRRNPHLWARPPQYNAAAKYELEKVGMTIDSVPSSGQVVRLGSTNSLSQGGESIAVLEELHPSIVEACIKTVQAVPGMEYCGVDFLLEDHTKPLDEQDAGVCELNAHAAIGNCQYPMFGQPQPVARTVMMETARRKGLAIASEPAEEVALHVTVRGKVTGVGFRQWLQRRAREAGVRGWVRNITSRRLEAVVVGPTAATTSVVSSLIVGPRRALPTSYIAKHIPKPALEGFEVLNDSDAPRAAE